MAKLLDTQPVVVEPLRWRHIVHGGRLFCLQSAIEIKVDLCDGVWTHEYKPLGILGYAESRAESLEAFRTDFAACWDSIAQEPDENLTGDAQELKRGLLALVDCVEPLQ
jgi:hypothetical protein